MSIEREVMPFPSSQEQDSFNKSEGTVQPNTTVYAGQDAVPRDVELYTSQLHAEDVDLLKLRAKGYGIKEIGSETNQSTKAVKHKLSRIHKNLGIPNSLSAVVVVINHGLIDIEEVASGYDITRYQYLHDHERDLLEYITIHPEQKLVSVAKSLGCTESTIKNKLSRIYDMLNINNIVSAVIFNLERQRLENENNSGSSKRETGSKKPGRIIWQEKGSKQEEKKERKLSEFQKIYLESIAKGMSNFEIAKMHGRSRSSLEYTNNRVKHILGVHKRAHMVAEGIRSGLIDSSKLGANLDYSLYDTLLKEERKLLDLLTDFPQNDYGSYARQLGKTQTSLNQAIYRLYNKLGLTGQISAVVYNLERRRREEIAKSV